MWRSETQVLENYYKGVRGRRGSGLGGARGRAEGRADLSLPVPGGPRLPRRRGHEAEAEERVSCLLPGVDRWPPLRAGAAR